MRRILRDGWRVLEITTHPGVAPSPGLRDPDELTATLQSLAADPANAHVLRAVLAECEPFSPSRWAGDDQLAADVAKAILSGMAALGAVRPDRLRSSLVSESETEPPPSGPEPPPAAPAALTWIGIVLVGPDGKPRPGVKYEIRLPDGSTRKGKLGSSGLARIEEIPAGECEIAFPELDASAWKPV